VATLDSGVDLFHPDLAPSWRGGSGTLSWFDPHGENATPNDVSGHGTGVMGLIVGGDNSGTTSVSRANNPAVHLATGAVDQSLIIASGSARGPSTCTAGYFPHVVAPGIDVETTGLTFGGLIPNSYLSVSGTSVAAPHVAGAFALLKSAFPGSTLSALESAVEQTTVDLGPSGPDDQYGAGFIDVEAAYLDLSAGGAEAFACPHSRVQESLCFSVC
jgi:subtilisin family serine protease